jgi:rare lipoprotein A
MRPISRRGWYTLLLLTAVVALLLFATRPRPAPPAPPPVHYGLASYYGPGFHGRETASGRIFNQAEMVAAHRTLPLGTLVRVTNLKNGRAVTLRVIDRGPYGRNHRRGTIIDVSKGAAQRLQFLRDGLVRVRVEILEGPDASSTRRAARNDSTR